MTAHAYLLVFLCMAGAAVITAAFVAAGLALSMNTGAGIVDDDSDDEVFEFYFDGKPLLARIDADIEGRA